MSSNPDLVQIFGKIGEWVSRNYESQKEAEAIISFYENPTSSLQDFDELGSVEPSTVRRIITILKMRNR